MIKINNKCNLFNKMIKLLKIYNNQNNYPIKKIIFKKLIQTKIQTINKIKIITKII